ncbi:META domain-containing protein [Flavihumibacter sp.]|uniref:META domain-containing protein n=1 Tax=Flavihumibacter sp. TaxID=1913981 RepID=UPI002FC8882A|nr:META domain-containing protein [Flavihumibacter sediminis]
MKNFLPAFLLILLIACQNNAPDQKENKIVIDSAISNLPLSSAYCYQKASNRDTVRLEYTMNGDSVNGFLSYNFYGKDKSKGTISGRMLGDTLLAMYTFFSEGMTSIREVIFLKKGNQMVEGYGEMKELEGKMYFTDRRTNEFGKFNVLDICATKEDKIVSSGSESLYQFHWHLLELNGKMVDTSVVKGAYLAFIPGTVGTVNGNTGCNSLRGSFELDADQSIKFSPLIMTRKACIGVNIENDFLEALSKVTRWKIMENKLLFYSRDTLTIRFNAVALSGS